MLWCGIGWAARDRTLVLRSQTNRQATRPARCPFEIQGDGSQTRSFIYIDDFIDGLLAAVVKGEHRNVYHIGTMDELSIRELVETIFAWFGREPEIIAGPAPAGGTPRRCPDIAKLAALGFAPKVPLAEGVAGVAAWYVENAHMKPKA